MLTYKDCLDLCPLSSEEIQAIAEHEHLPEIIALELGDYLVHTPEGERRIKAIIIDDIEIARRRGEVERLERLELVLKHFIATHPEARPG